MVFKGYFSFQFNKNAKKKLLIKYIVEAVNLWPVSQNLH